MFLYEKKPSACVCVIDIRRRVSWLRISRRREQVALGFSFAYGGGGGGEHSGTYSAQREIWREGERNLDPRALCSPKESRVERSVYSLTGGKSWRDAARGFGKVENFSTDKIANDGFKVDGGKSELREIRIN